MSLNKPINPIERQQHMRIWILDAVQARVLEYISNVSMAQMQHQLPDTEAFAQIESYVTWLNKFKENMRNLP